ncbi:PPM-type phosphatase domain-containing protein [Balamuthia mandrillaris]
MLVRKKTRENGDDSGYSSDQEEPKNRLFVPPRLELNKSEPNLLARSFQSHTQQGNDEYHSEENQDRHSFTLDEERSLLWLGVYDGHSGSCAAEFVSNNLVDNITKFITGDPPYTIAELETAMKDGILFTEEQFSQLKEPDGACVLLACIQGEDVIIANVGDSRAMLGSVRPGSSGALHDLSVRVLTNDHNASNPQEAKLARFRFLVNNGVLPKDSTPESFTTEELIEKVKEIMDGSDIISNGRLLTVEITRSIGDFGVKKYCYGVISPEPEFSRYKLEPNDRVLILGSDGVMNAFEPEKLVNLVYDKIQNLSSYYHHSPSEALIKAAVEAGCGDDQTVLILDLRTYIRALKKGEDGSMSSSEGSPLMDSIKKGLFITHQSEGYQYTSRLNSSVGRSFTAKLARLHQKGVFVGSPHPQKFERDAKRAQIRASDVHREASREVRKGELTPVRTSVLGIWDNNAVEQTKTRKKDDLKRSDSLKYRRGY